MNFGYINVLMEKFEILGVEMFLGVFNKYLMALLGILVIDFDGRMLGYGVSEFECLVFCMEFVGVRGLGGI